MLNFDFYNPTQIVFGKDRIFDLAKLVPGAAKVLILVGGASAEKTGTLAEVRQALGTRQHDIFSGIEPNPSFDTAMQAVQKVRDGGFDFLLAVGGGSVIDAAKFIAAAVPFEGDAWDILLQGGRNIKSALPFGTVLTLPATGSEMNNGSVITRRDIGAKLPFRSRHLFPQFSVLDPTKTYTLPAQQLANGVVDAFVHTVEQYLTYPVNAPLQDRFAESLLQTLVDIGPRLLAAPEPDYDDRASLMWSATLALNGLIGAGVPQDWATHMIGHELTALHNIDHARTLAIVLPAMLSERRVQKRAKLLQYGERVWGIRSGSDEERISAAIDQTRDFFERMGIPTRLSAYGLGAEAIDVVIRQLEAHGMTQLSEHRDVTPAVSRRVLEAAL
ncbi:MAG: iron-containing alcohol dehydrogenase [Gammaproteobacteria bacterium]|uniref:iron-containing alcohol dehydrogenase n=1 Tax=Rhodoferax sp. TaxID=50421 RepID=UPI0017CEEF50|nr:iron-containing alcohol dehydrogenase [Rhodoferax sp.]MBU3900843.1 iron-containing alcohol dehydrogenase [Gammaproteobacteria bacterium]MBA3060004.1 iron-containing alcohol dehydrogenase [Rhodoferax sp.]MBU3996605.1 iron-containing alcohol dehydrogenase [Gammaproteobacteria bacterium]MBU4079594.1 iron-containing alcohol dehydrogenase [Gammaproteobacteria bacterium]MBU4112228.1 iron-containing alcohol dehydrogenase [Gammaproteobacteria bacterium]